jgi:hypothetical protein
MSQITTDMFPLRINLPGYGPKIITALMSNLSTTDLRAQTCDFTGAGAPAASTLLAGNGKYIVGDRYIDTTNTAAYVCTAAGSNASSVWAQTGSSGGGGSSVWL